MSTSALSDLSHHSLPDPSVHVMSDPSGHVMSDPFDHVMSSHGGSESDQSPVTSSNSLYVNFEERHNSAYVAKAVGHALIKCLKDVLEVRPRDPIEFMAHWLYKYADNEMYLKEKEQRAANVLVESMRQKVETEKHLLRTEEIQYAMTKTKVGFIKEMKKLSDFTFQEKLNSEHRKKEQLKKWQSIKKIVKNKVRSQVNIESFQWPVSDHNLTKIETADVARMVKEKRERLREQVESTIRDTVMEEHMFSGIKYEKVQRQDTKTIHVARQKNVRSVFEKQSAGTSEMEIYMLDDKSYMLDDKSYILDDKSYMLDDKSYMLDDKSYMLDDKSYMLDDKSYMLDDKSYMLDDKSYMLDDKSYMLDDKSYMLDDKSYMLDDKSYMLDDTS
ncbi:uncharacterized protein LOC131946072 [Physella acuta]|uniref:uncharacterized protein LOC131946072 n=1 Tax=Physella acuta TaxID=109671 RepID=UPI0027DB6EF6|nr:uncharacterized protein LOC131946072 [Physella acuta]